MEQSFESEETTPPPIHFELRHSLSRRRSSNQGVFSVRLPMHSQATGIHTAACLAPGLQSYILRIPPLCLKYQDTFFGSSITNGLAFIRYQSFDLTRYPFFCFNMELQSPLTQQSRPDYFEPKIVTLYRDLFRVG
jgi:hypothetical protein